MNSLPGASLLQDGRGAGRESLEDRSSPGNRLRAAVLLIRIHRGAAQLQTQEARRKKKRKKGTLVKEADSDTFVINEGV